MIIYLNSLVHSQRFQALSLVVLAGIIMALMWWNAQPATPPFSYVREPALVVPDQTFCPGDTVHYRSTSQTRVPEGSRVVVATVRTLWSVSARRTARPATADEIRVVIWRETVRIEGGSTYQLPEGLAPGPYELRLASILAGQDSSTVGAELPIIIRQGCP